MCVRQFGIRTVRSGARWHLIESSQGVYDFRSLETILDAAQRAEVEVLLDLLHFGWPDYVDVFSKAFPNVFGRFVHALTRFVRRSGVPIRMFAPLNEISFLSWGGGQVACINPYARKRGPELKRNLVRAAATASEILLNELDGIRLISPEPIIHIVGNPRMPGSEVAAERYRLAQFEAWDMLSGRVAPELGGRPEYLDIIGVNFYDRNQWVHKSKTLRRTDPRYRPLRHMLHEVWTRYQRPMFISETGTENELRADWFRYVSGEILAAHEAGVPVHGLCLYPILNHPGWEDDRHCCNGLFDYADESGNREVHWPLANAIVEQQELLLRSVLTHVCKQNRSHLSFSPAVGFRLSTASALDEPFCPVS